MHKNGRSLFGPALFAVFAVTVIAPQPGSVARAQGVPVSPPPVMTPLPPTTSIPVTPLLLGSSLPSPAASSTASAAV